MEKYRTERELGLDLEDSADIRLASEAEESNVDIVENQAFPMT